MAVAAEVVCSARSRAMGASPLAFEAAKAAIQSPTVYTAALSASKTGGDGPSALLRALQTPAAAVAISRAGLEPLARTR